MILCTLADSTNKLNRLFQLLPHTKHNSIRQLHMTFAATAPIHFSRGCVMSLCVYSKQQHIFSKMQPVLVTACVVSDGCQCFGVCVYVIQRMLFLSLFEFDICEEMSDTAHVD